jgi:hypothetical protein
MEVTVNDRDFDVPLYVRTGEHLIQEITTLDDALDFLEEWPANLQGPIYETALRACQRAYNGDVSLSVARGAFAGFAKSARIHEEVDALLPPPGRWTSSPGGVPR